MSWAIYSLNWCFPLWQQTNLIKISYIVHNIPLVFRMSRALTCLTGDTDWQAKGGDSCSFIESIKDWKFKVTL